MTHDDLVRLSQAVGAVKRARRTAANAQSEILATRRAIAGTYTEHLLQAGGKSLGMAIYWLEQAIGTFDLAVSKAKAKE